MKVVSPVPYTPFILTLFSTKYKKYYDIPRKAILDGIEVYYPRAIFLPRNIDFKSEGHKVYKGIKKTVRNIYKDFKFDIIHAHVDLPEYEALKIEKVPNAKIVYDVHEHYPDMVRMSKKVPKPIRPSATYIADKSKLSISKRFNFIITADVAKNIEMLLEDKDLIKPMDNNGMKAISEEFNWKEEEKKLMDIYKFLGGINNENI